MKTIVAWVSAHPIVTWSVAGVAAIAVLLFAATVIFVLVQRQRCKDRSGVTLTADLFTAVFDERADEIVFTWTSVNPGKFAARRLRTTVNLRITHGDDLSATWRLSREVTALEPGTHADFALRIARSELIRLARDFKDGNLTMWSYYSASSPKKPAGIYIAPGLRKRFKLAVGQVGGQDCVTLTDPTPVDFYQSR